MLMLIVGILIRLIVFLFIEIYAFQALKVLTRKKLYHWIWIGISTLVYLLVFGILFIN